MTRQLISFALALLAPALAAQETTGSARGRVLSTTGSPIANAQIAASGPTLLGTRKALSASDGVFTLSALPPGRYVVRIVAIGLRPAVLDSVEVQLGRTTGLVDVRMQTAGAATLAEMRIVAPKLVMDPVRTTIGATLQSEDLAALPGDRDYKSLITMVPHVNGSGYGDTPNAAGSSGPENMYFIDGVNVTLPSMATTGISLPYNFIRSVEVRTGGYEAQFGRSLGAIVNAITYTGTNAHEASVFAFVMPGALAAQARTQPTLRETGAYSYDVGVRFGGPVIRDRLWYSAAYNPRVDRSDREIGTFGTFTDRRTAQIFAGKLTFQASPDASLELSVFGDPTTRNAVEARRPGLKLLNVEPYLHLIQTGGTTVSARAAVWLSPALSVDVALSRTSSRDRFDADSERGRNEGVLINFAGGTFGGGHGFFNDARDHRTTAVVRLKHDKGRHAMVGGAEYDVASSRQVFGTPPGGNTYRRPTPWYNVERHDSPMGTVQNLVPTLYVQDSWRATDRLTINGGLRWSSQTLTKEGGGVGQRFENELQPRFGFSWAPGAPNSQRVFGSFGRFYQQEPLNLAAVWYRDHLHSETYYSTNPAQADSVVLDNTFAKDRHSVSGVEAEHFDEFTLGYERLIGVATRVSVRAMRRDLRSSFQWGYDPTQKAEKVWVIGTPGEGAFSFLPRPKREYSALEVSVDRSWRQLEARASYVWSRNWGNFPGLFDSDSYTALPGRLNGFFDAGAATNSTGLLPNDRTHVLKGTAIYRPMQRFTGGAFLTWQSGTPLNDLGYQAAWPNAYAFLAPRGSAGRTPEIWDLNLRATYEVPRTRVGALTLVADLLHVGNPRGTVRQDQDHYYAVDAQRKPIAGTVNGGWLKPLTFQQPMAARLGVEVRF